MGNQSNRRAVRFVSSGARWSVVWILAMAMTLSGFILVVGCTSTGGDGLNQRATVEVENVETGCKSSGRKDRIRLEDKGSYDLLAGTLQVPNPCQELEVDHTKSGGTLTVDLRTVSKGGACVMCVGTLEYRLKIRTDAEHLRVRYHDKTLLEESLP